MEFIFWRYRTFTLFHIWSSDAPSTWLEIWPSIALSTYSNSQECAMHQISHSAVWKWCPATSRPSRKRRAGNSCKNTTPGSSFKFCSSWMNPNWYLDIHSASSFLFTPRQDINLIVDLDYWLFVLLCAEEKEMQKAEEGAEGVSSAKRRNGVLRAYL